MFSGAEPEGHIVRRVISEAKSLSFDECEDIVDFLEWTCEVIEFRTLPGSCWISIYRVMSGQGHCYHYSNGSAPVWVAQFVNIQPQCLHQWCPGKSVDDIECSGIPGEWPEGGWRVYADESGRTKPVWKRMMFLLMVAVMVNVKCDTSRGYLGRGNLPENALSDCSVGKFLRHFLG